MFCIYIYKQQYEQRVGMRLLKVHLNRSGVDRCIKKNSVSLLPSVSSLKSPNFSLLFFKQPIICLMGWDLSPVALVIKMEEKLVLAVSVCPELY